MQKLFKPKKMPIGLPPVQRTWRNDAQGAVHQAGASLPFDKVAAGSIRAQGRKLTIVFWDEKFVYFRENRRVYEL